MYRIQEYSVCSTTTPSSFWFGSLAACKDCNLPKVVVSAKKDKRKCKLCVFVVLLRLHRCILLFVTSDAMMLTSLACISCLKSHIDFRLCRHIFLFFRLNGYKIQTEYRNRCKVFDYITNGDSREFHIKGTKIGFSENGLLRSAYFGYMELEVEERTSNNTLRSVRPGLDF